MIRPVLWLPLCSLVPLACQGSGALSDDDSSVESVGDDDATMPTGDDDTTAGDDDTSADDDTTAAGEARLVLNEFEAANHVGITDETGAYADWVEVFNDGGAVADLTGHTLTDDFAEPDKWTFPAGTTLAPGGFLLVFCDGDTADGPLHTSFKISATGEDLGLYGPAADGSPELDALHFGAQADDTSYGRYPDGSPDWYVDDSPTPGEPNG